MAELVMNSYSFHYFCMDIMTKYLYVVVRVFESWGQSPFHMVQLAKLPGSIRQVGYG